MVELCGSDAEEARLVAENLVTGNLKGHDSHGVGYLPRYVGTALKGNLVPNQRVKIVHETETMLTLEGGRGYGQSIGRQAMEMGIAKAKEHQMCIVALRNSHHLARIGAWAEMCTQEGLASIHFVNVAGHAPLVAPHNGADARLGTNPFTIGFPDLSADAGTSGSARRDVVLDFATSKVALGKAREAMGRGEQMEEGNLLDAEGRPTTDPCVNFVEPKGCLTPFGGHKGYALALMCELLGAVATGGQTIEPKWERDDTILNSMLTIIVDPLATCGGPQPDLFEGSVAARVAAQAADLVDFCTASPERPGADGPAVAPGDPERAMVAEREATGIPLAEGTWQEILAAAESLGMGEAEVEKIMRVGA
jgi:uncharacterized oxidoreductase